MFERPLRYLAIVLSSIIALSFIMFAWENTQAASDATTTAIATGQTSAKATSTASLEQAREARHGKLRRKIDAANNTLTRPFAAAVETIDSGWGKRIVSGSLGLLLWGAGLAFLARAVAGKVKSPRAPHHADHGLYPEKRPGPPPPLPPAPPGY